MPFWYVPPVPRTHGSIPENGHCWHTVAYRLVFATRVEERCCYCGLTWNEGMRTSPSGHGEFAPKEIPVPKPTGKCTGR